MESHAPISTVLRPSPIEGKGDRSAVDEVPTRAPDFILSLSGTSESDLTANLIDALRAARVNIRCPSKAAVRAGIFFEGFRSTRNPSKSPHKAAGIRDPGGDGLRPAGVREGKHSPAVRQCAFLTP